MRPALARFGAPVPGSRSLTSSHSPAGARSVPRTDLPRERLAAQGAEALADAELVALILRTGAAGQPAVELARILLSRPSGLRGLSRALPAELRAAPGVGAAKAAALAASFELGRRVAGRRLRPGDPIRSAADVHRHFYPQLRDAPRERFLVLLLDGRHRVIRPVVASEGTLTASLVHPREVFAPALKEPAAAVVLVHNHPSGDPTPSREDREVTARLCAAGDLLGIPVLDHVVVAEQGFVSLREEGGLGARPGDAAAAEVAGS
jgi:DNA repair protein RadC